MSARFILNLVGVVGWLVAALFAYAFLTLFGFFGVGFYGLLVLFICMQVELEPADAAAQQWRRWTVLFKILGLLLSVAGFGGFLWFQLD